MPRPRACVAYAARHAAIAVAAEIGVHDVVPAAPRTHVVARIARVCSFALVIVDSNATVPVVSTHLRSQCSPHSHPFDGHCANAPCFVRRFHNLVTCTALPILCLVLILLTLTFARLDCTW